MGVLGKLFKPYSILYCLFPRYLITLCECLNCVLYYFFKDFLFVKQTVLNQDFKSQGGISQLLGMVKSFSKNKNPPPPRGGGCVVAAGG